MKISVITSDQIPETKSRPSPAGKRADGSMPPDIAIDIGCVHCSDVVAGTPEGIRRYHVKKNGWRDIGYHLVIENGYATAKSKYNESADGRITLTRDFAETGAHALGINHRSIGICYIGKRPSERQLAALQDICLELSTRGLDIIGHYETRHEAKKGRGRKTCPNIDMDMFRESIGIKPNK